MVVPGHGPARSTGRPSPTDARTDPVELGYGDRPLATYVSHPDLPAALAPRPYLHPVYTLGGVPVTELMPHSHPYHLGVSLAVPDLDGGNFWGGRTFVPGHGPAWLDNHGTQRHEAWLSQTPGAIEQALRWFRVDGTPLLAEERAISCRPVTETAWALGFRFTLRNATGRPLPLRSPATLGRLGAGYGGFFWRAPASRRLAEVFGPASDDLAALHGVPAPWLAATGDTHDGREWTLLFVAATERTARDRWFVRTRDYIGVGSSLAWDEPLILPPDGTIARHIVTVVADGALPRPAAADLAERLRSAS